MLLVWLVLCWCVGLGLGLVWAGAVGLPGPLHEPPQPCNFCISWCRNPMLSISFFVGAPCRSPQAATPHTHPYQLLTVQGIPKSPLFFFCARKGRHRQQVGGGAFSTLGVLWCLVSVVCCLVSGVWCLVCPCNFCISWCRSPMFSISFCSAPLADHHRPPHPTLAHTSF